MIAIAERADALGYSSLWTSDHVLLPSELPDPYGNLLRDIPPRSAMSPQEPNTSGWPPESLCSLDSDPLLVAKQAATVHHLSGGRLTLGIGVGWIEKEYGYLRTDFHTRGRLADEYIPAIRTLLEADTPEFHGAHIDYSNVLFSPKPHVPLRIVVGGTSRESLARAATLGDGWHGIYQSPERHAPQSPPSTRSVATPPSRFRCARSPGWGTRSATWPPAAASKVTSPAIVNEIGRYADAGVHHLVIEPVSSDLDNFIEQITQFARDVVPRSTTT